MKKFLVFILVVLMLTAYTQGAVASVGLGGRAIGMGGAFTAIADDATAAYWNPAGLTQIKFGLTPTFGGLGDWSGATDMLDKMGQMSGTGTFTELSELGIKEAGIMANFGVGLNFRGFALNLYTQPNVETGGLGEKEGDLNGNLPLFLSFSLARRFTDLVSAGINVKGVSLVRSTASYKMEDIQVNYQGNPVSITAPNGEVKNEIGSGFALDLGGLFKVGDRVRFGAVVRNIPLSSIKLEGSRSKTDIQDLEEKLETMTPQELEDAIEAGLEEVLLTTEDHTATCNLPTVLVLGAAFKLPFTGTLLAADYELPFSSEADGSFHLGLEQPLLNIIFLRVGGYTADDLFFYTAGAGIKLGPLLLDLAAVQGKENQLGYFLTGGFKF